METIQSHISSIDAKHLENQILTQKISKPVSNSTDKFKKNEILLYRSLKSYYKQHPENIKLMIDIIFGNSNISLRILDFFVIRYAKKYKVKYDVDYEGINESFLVYINYRAQLKSFTKKYFDPFRRKVKFNFNYSNDQSIWTTLGQLNFFKWAITSKIIDYVKDHYDEIVKSMNGSYKENKKKKEIVVKKISVPKNKDIKITAKKQIKNQVVDITVSFE
jgi:hypothetical protein